MKALKLIIGILAIVLISHISYMIFDYIFNPTIVFYSAMVITLYIAYKGYKADTVEKKDNKFKNNSL